MEVTSPLYPHGFDIAACSCSARLPSPFKLPLISRIVLHAAQNDPATHGLTAYVHTASQQRTKGQAPVPRLPFDNIHF